MGPRSAPGRESVDLAVSRRTLDVIQATVDPTARVLSAPRRSGSKVIYLKMEFRADLSDLGAPEAKFCSVMQRVGIGTPTTAPDGQPSRAFIRGTWGTDIVAGLAPEASDVVVSKHRFSGFYGTELDVILRGLGIRYLVFCGCTTRVCVESTLRDAMVRDYNCLLLADCTAEPIGHGLPRTNHEASLLVTQLAFGWVAESVALLRALDGLGSPRPSANGAGTATRA